jgi:DNA-directed RNA polymerase specialized sigma24 family protein
VLEALRSPSAEEQRRGAELLVRAYRAPVRDLLAWKWHLGPEDAEDRVQEFFARALEKRWFDRFDAGRGRFRSYLRVLANRFVAHALEAESRQKRGGGQVLVPLELVGDLLPDGDQEAERRFRDAWVRSVFELALQALREEALGRDRAVHLALFEAYDLAGSERPSYADLGRAHHLGDSQVINHLAWARRRFRHHVLATVRSLAGSESEYRDDVRDLLGIEA